MIEEITRPRNGITPRAHETLMPQAANRPVITLNSIASQNLVLPLRVNTAISIVTRLNTISPTKMMLTTSASDSIITKCRRAVLNF